MVKNLILLLVLVAEIKGIIEQTDANNVVMSVKDIKLADQTMLVAENLLLPQPL